MTRRPRQPAVWVAFGLVHAWLAFLGVVVAPSASFHDVDLYRYWMYLGLHAGQWPVLDDPWVYPAGAIAPMLLPALGSATATTGYAIGWCLLITLLNGVATVFLLRHRDPEHPDATPRGAWWWLALLLLLGPVAIGRLDGVIAPLMLLGLLAGVRRPRIASVLLAAGAWIKIGPGALLLPLAIAARRPVRDVVVPALAVCGVVVVGVASLGGLGNLLSFASVQQGRGLQVESVTATPWVIAALSRDDVFIELNNSLVTWEVHGPGTAAAARWLDVVLVLGVGVVAALLWRARQEGRADVALLPGALALLAVLIVANKVGSPQFLTWLAPPVAVLLTVRSGVGPRWLRATAVVVLAAAGLTQIVFPWGYLRLLTGDPLITAVLVARNVLLVALLVIAVVGLVRIGRAEPAAAAEPEPVTGQ